MQEVKVFFKKTWLFLLVACGVAIMALTVFEN